MANEKVIIDLCSSDEEEEDDFGDENINEETEDEEEDDSSFRYFRTVPLFIESISSGYICLYRSLFVVWSVTMISIGSTMMVRSQI